MKAEFDSAEPGTDLAKIKDDLAPNLITKFPLWHYLHLNVRITACELMTMTWRLWLPVVICFACFMCLHRFAHMGYVRIMSFFAVLLLAVIVQMAYKVHAAGTLVKAGSGKATPTPKSQQGLVSEGFWMWSLQFALFFLCYFVARAICQPW